jgi:cysteine desulfurase
VQAGIDLMSISGHKLHGPKGVGCLYVRKSLRLEPLLAGGGQEQGLRSGTHNVPGIAGLAKAAVLAEEQREDFIRRCREWKEAFIHKVEKELPGVLFNGDLSPEGGAPYIISLSFPGLKSEVIVHALEEKGCYVSSKSACSSKLQTPSRVLKAMGRTDEEALGSIRVSMGMDTTREEVERCADLLIQVIPPLQQVMRVRVE